LYELKQEADRIPDMTEIMGDFIDREIIMSRHTATGGCANEILGPQGTGKTSLMLSYACRVMEENPDEIIIWRDSYQSPCQFNRVKKWEIFVEKGTNLQIRDINLNEIVELPITTFQVSGKHNNDYGGLIEQMKPQQLNVVYVRDQVIGYVLLINYLKTTRGWQSIFIDEYEDIAPLNCSGPKYRLIGALGSEMKNIRKGLVSLFCNTQSKSQIDWRVRDTFMIETYLSGARKDKGSSVYQNAINGLQKGTAWVSWEGKFGRINYPAFPPKSPIYVADDLNRVSDLDLVISEIQKQ